MSARRTTADRTAPPAERAKATATKRARKAPAKAATEAERVPQPHGGALLKGGVPGNRGGFGSLPSQLRDLARQGAEKGIALAARIAAGDAIPQTLVTNAETGATMDVAMRADHMAVVRATDVLVKHGLGPQLAVDDARARVAATHDLLRAELPPDLFARVAPKLAQVWA